MNDNIYILNDDTNMIYIMHTVFVFYSIYFLYYLIISEVIIQFFQSAVTRNWKFETYLSCEVANRKGRNLKSLNFTLQKVTERQPVKVPLTPLCLPLSTVHQMPFICSGAQRETTNWSFRRGGGGVKNRKLESDTKIQRNTLN